MLNASELWKELDAVTQECGLQLYDIDMPSSKAVVMRIYIAKPKSESGVGEGVTVDVCEAVSRKITSNPKLSWITDSYALEVSSPGINRRLQRREHFEGAVGERVKLTVSEFGKADETLVGKVLECSDGFLNLAIDGDEANIRKIALDDVRKAHVDFVFE